jgi:uncharacterized membrane protein
MGLISALAGLLQIILPTLFPKIDPVTLTVVLGAITVFLGTFIAFLANTSTTPTSDPQLKAGTMVRVTDAEGVMIGHAPIEAPAVPDEAEKG